MASDDGSEKWSTTLGTAGSAASHPEQGTEAQWPYLWCAGPRESKGDCRAEEERTHSQKSWKVQERNPGGSVSAPFHELSTVWRPPGVPGAACTNPQDSTLRIMSHRPVPPLAVWGHVRSPLPPMQLTTANAISSTPGPNPMANTCKFHRHTRLLY